MRLRYAIMLTILMWLPSTVLAESFIIENKNNAPLFTDKSGEVPANLKKNETTEKFLHINTFITKLSLFLMEKLLRFLL